MLCGLRYQNNHLVMYVYLELFKVVNNHYGDDINYQIQCQIKQ